MKEEGNLCTECGKTALPGNSARHKKCIPGAMEKITEILKGKECDHVFIPDDGYTCKKCGLSVKEDESYKIIDNSPDKCEHICEECGEEFCHYLDITDNNSCIISISGHLERCSGKLTRLQEIRERIEDNYDGGFTNTYTRSLGHACSDVSYLIKLIGRMRELRD